MKEKEEIRSFGRQLGADAVGFAAIEDYRSERSPNPGTLLSNVKSVVVLGYREINGAVESENPRVSMASRMAGTELAMKNNYLLSRHLENRYGARAASIPFSYPMDMGKGVGDLSLRHAAVAAGLGVFGRHNLVIHPEFGTRIVFTAVLTNLPLSSDPTVQDKLCTECGLCVEACPGGALDNEGKTDLIACLKNSQPHGAGGALRYLRQFIGAAPEEQKQLLKDPVFLNLYQAPIIGFHYHCFRCLAVCPACLAGNIQA